MTTIVDRKPDSVAALALAEGLDYPRAGLVTLGPENPFLQCLARMEGAEGAWHHAVSWLEGTGTAGDCLTELRREYYRLFLSPGRDLSCYLHEWYPESAPQTFLGDWRGFLLSVDLAPRGLWRNGVDHVAIVFEVLAHLLHTDHAETRQFTRAYVTPWLGRFAERLGVQATSGFYTAIAGVAGGVANEVRNLR